MNAYICLDLDWSPCFMHLLMHSLLHEHDILAKGAPLICSLSLSLSLSLIHSVLCYYYYFSFQWLTVCTIFTPFDYRFLRWNRKCIGRQNIRHQTKPPEKQNSHPRVFHRFVCIVWMHSSHTLIAENWV